MIKAVRQLPKRQEPPPVSKCRECGAVGVPLVNTFDAVGTVASKVCRSCARELSQSRVGLGYD